MAEIMLISPPASEELAQFWHHSASCESFDTETKCTMNKVVVAIVILRIVIHNFVAGSQSLQLIALVPTGNERSNRCVDRGEELVQAAKIAVNAINANEDILKDYTLSVVVGSSDICTAESFVDALTEFVRHITNNSDVERSASVNPVGIIGMVCSSAMLHVSPFASLSSISLLQVTAGTTPPIAITRSRSRVTISHIYQAAPPSTIHNDALIALMKEQNWKRIAMVRLTSGLNIIHVNQGIDLQAKLSEHEFNVTFNGEITTGEDGAGLEEILNEIENRMARIIYVSLPDQEARNLLCLSYWRNIMSPLYTWILHDNPLEILKRKTRNCTEEMMTIVLNGTILFQYKIINDRNRTLDHTNLTYNEYEELYKWSLLNESGNNTLCGEEPEIIHSNAMYDSVIALALALNKSQATINLTDYGRGMLMDTAEINKTLMEVNFTGAGGQISFNNKTHELNVSNVGVNIYRISNLSYLPYAYYSSSMNSVERRMYFSTEISDRFGEYIRQVHFALSGVILAVIVILVVIGIVVLSLYVYHYNNPDIKATSPVLSIVVLCACFLLYVSAIFTALRSSFYGGTILFSVLCIFEMWTFVISIQVIFATLFMRLLRVYRIFFHYQKVGKLWSDGGLLLFVAMLTSPSIILLILWTSIDPLKTGKSLSVFRFSPTDPHFDIYLDCHSNHLGVWLSIILGYTGLIMIAVLALAVMTRKVKIESFRDTKEVNAFVFTTVFLIVLFIPLSWFLQGPNDAALYSTFVLRELGQLLVPIACKVFVFAPKIYYAHFTDPTRHKSTTFHTSGKHTNNPKSSFSNSGTV